MRIYAVIAIFGLSLLLTGCPEKPDKDEHAMSMGDTETSSMTSEKGMSEHMDGEKKMEGTTEQSDSQ